MNNTGIERLYNPLALARAQIACSLMASSPAPLLRQPRIIYATPTSICLGIVTLGIVTLGIVTLGIVTLGIVTVEEMLRGALDIFHDSPVTLYRLKASS